MFTETIIGKLNALEEAPWGELHGKPLNPRGLAQRLRRYGVSSKTVRIGNHTAKGYSREDLWDAWERYLPTTKDPDVDVGASTDKSVTSVTTAPNAPRESQPSPSESMEAIRDLFEAEVSQ